MPASSKNRNASFRLLCQLVAKATVSKQRDLLPTIEHHHDWSGFLAQLRWHRVHSLIWPVIQEYRQHFPDHVVAQARALHQQSILQAMAQTAELGRLATHFQAANIPYLVLKGRPLSQWLYDDYSIRFSKDLDLLIEPEHIEEAHKLLIDMGYVRNIPEPHVQPQIMEYYTRVRKDASYIKPGMQIELHWRLDNNPNLLPLDTLRPFEDVQWIELPGSQQPVLSVEKQFVYLLMHASTSSWMRLSWLTDFIRILQMDLDWERLKSRCHQTGMERVLNVTLLLIEKNFGIEAPAPLRPPMTPDISTQILLRIAQNSLVQNHYQSYGILLFARFLSFGEQQSFRGEFFKALSVSINDIALLPLPRRWFWLYYPLRPFLWLWRRTPFHTDSAI